MDTATIFSYLTKMNETGASDLYLTVNHVPVLRVEDAFQNVGTDVLDTESLQEIIYSILTAKQRREFDVNWELNTSIDMGRHGRFRVNVMRQRQNPSLVIRRIVTNIPTIADLHLPPVLEKLALEKRGLILVTGMTGSGKSTSLASMINYRNQNSEGHIITIEDPIEYYHEHKKSIITQREVGIDTESYRTALKNSLRQRPDVILIGEVRDKDVMEQALTIAETGHLCLATLHTTNAYQAIERIVNFFPEEQHHQIRLNLSMNLKAIISQRLIPSIEGALVPAIEVMINEALIRDLIEEGRYDKVAEVMEKNNNIGMQTFDQSLLGLYTAGLISEDTVLNHSDKSSDVKVKLQQMKMSQSTSGLQNMDTSLLKVSE